TTTGRSGGKTSNSLFKQRVKIGSPAASFRFLAQKAVSWGNISPLVLVTRSTRGLIFYAKSSAGTALLKQVKECRKVAARLALHYQVCWIAPTNSHNL